VTVQEYFAAPCMSGEVVWIFRSLLSASSLIRTARIFVTSLFAHRQKLGRGRLILSIVLEGRGVTKFENPRYIVLSITCQSVGSDG
jgi:hypothetical protein